MRCGGSWVRTGRSMTTIVVEVDYDGAYRSDSNISMIDGTRTSGLQ